MTTFPLPLMNELGPLGAYLVYMVIGFGFGFVLEQAGFGNARKLAAQFYFKEMTVIKVMFGAIVVAMLLIFLASGLGLLDYNALFVNPTYLWPGIVGGLIMGVGFILGGFCPGTSLVSAATGKIDGFLFLMGVFFGIFIFGEAVGGFEEFYNSSFFGRLTLPEWLNVNTGVVVLVITLMALFVFFGSEQLEKLFGKRDLSKEPKWRLPAAGGLAALAVVVLAVGQPTPDAKWALVAEAKEPLLKDRAVQVEHVEVLTLLDNKEAKVNFIDVRPKADYEGFHIRGAQNVEMSALQSQLATMRGSDVYTVYFLVSADEKAATEAWKFFTAEHITNVYILEGGMNKWIDTFGSEEFRTAHAANTQGEDVMHYTFATPLGETDHASSPTLDDLEVDFFGLEFTPKVKFGNQPTTTGGGCG